MKKLLTILLATLMLLTLAGCGAKEEAQPEVQEPEQQEEEPVVDPAPTAKNTYADFVAAELDEEIEVLMSVQAHESWWDGKITIYGQDDDGGYLVYECACDENTANALTEGTLIRVKGVKAEWAGEVEIADGTLEIIAGNYDGTVYEPTDLTDLLGNNDELIKHMNVKGAFKNLTVVSYEAEEGSDGYLTVNDANGNEVVFVVRRYLTPLDGELGQAVAALAEGDVVDLTAYLYWYEAPQARIVEVVKH